MNQDNALVDRLAQADKPTRELLWQAFEAVYPLMKPQTDLANPLRLLDEAPQMNAYFQLPGRFTAMLDAEAWTSAVEMLVPEGHFWAVGTSMSERHRYDATCLAMCDRWKTPDTPWHYHKHPALALAIACLKARGAVMGEGPYFWIDEASNIPERVYRFDYAQTKDADCGLYVDDRGAPGPRGSNRKATAKRRAANRAARKARKAPK